MQRYEACLQAHAKPWIVARQGSHVHVVGAPSLGIKTRPRCTSKDGRCVHLAHDHQVQACGRACSSAKHSKLCHSMVLRRFAARTHTHLMSGLWPGREGSLVAGAPGVEHARTGPPPAQDPSQSAHAPALQPLPPSLASRQGQSPMHSRASANRICTHRHRSASQGMPAAAAGRQSFSVLPAACCWALPPLQA